MKHSETHFMSKLYHECKCCKCNKDAQQFAFVEKRNKCLLATRDHLPCFRSFHASMIPKNIKKHILLYKKGGIKSTQS